MLRRFFRIYPTLLKTGFAEVVAYRAEFVVWMLSTTLPLVMLALMSAVAREAPIGGFDQPKVVAYYLATLIVRQVASSWVMWEIMHDIREGTLAMHLLRPVHPLLARSAESLAGVPLRGLVALPVALLAARARVGRDHVHPTSLIIGCFFLSLAGAWLLNFAVSAMCGILALYVDSSQSIWEVWLGGFMLLSGYLLPLSLFPHWAEHIARMLPFPYLQAVPVEMITGARSRVESLRGLGFQFLYAAVALVAMQLFWRRAIRRFAAYGG